MLITLDFLVLIALIVLAIGSLGFAGMIILQIRQYCPSVFTFVNAAKNGKPLVRYHHANGTYEYCTPEFEGGDNSRGYYKVKGGRFKFVDVSGTKTERLWGKIPVFSVLDNLPEPVSALMAAHIDRLAGVLEERRYSIQGIEEEFYYAIWQVFKIQEVKSRPGAKWRDLSLDEQVNELLGRLETTLTEIRVNDEVTRGRLRTIIPYIMRHRDELEQAVNQLHPYPFTFQGIIRTLDNLFGFTSSNVYNMKMVVEADAKNTRGMKDLMPIIVVGFMVFIILIGVYFVTK